MKRRTARENAFIAAFEESFRPGCMQEILADSREDEALRVDDFGESLLTALLLHRQEVDRLIEPRLKNWKLNRLPRVSLIVLELAVTEMFYLSGEDLDSVIINEAVELVKKFGGEGDHQFVNGLLGSLSRGRAAAPGSRDSGQAKDPGKDLEKAPS